VIRYGNISALSDGATAATLARAAINGAGYNIRINTKHLPSSISEPLLGELIGLEQHATEVEVRIQKTFHERGL